MKNTSTILNLVLLAAVGFLFYKQFAAPKMETISAATSTDSVHLVLPVVSSAVPLANLPKGMPIVFVNADTIFSRYEFAKKAKAAGEGKVANYQKAYQAKVEAFQKEYNDYMEKAGAGAYTKEQGTAIEATLQKKKEEIVVMQQNQERVMGDLDNSNAEVQKKIYNFLSRFNKQHGYYCALAYTRAGGGILGINDSLDITPQVIAGLNAEYKTGK